jgi:vacuolar protein sorting-associated protein 26
VRVTVTRGLASTVTTEKDIWVHNYQVNPDVNNPIKMEVGIEDCLHIEFEYNRSKYHLTDVIIGNNVSLSLLRHLATHLCRDGL